MYTQNINVNIIPSGVRPVIHCSQYDNNLQAIRFTLYKDDVAFSVPSGAAVLINGRKPDHTGFSYPASAISGSTATFTVTQQMTAVYGDVLCELRVRTSNQIIGTINFILRVEEAPLQDDTILSETEIPLIEQAVDIAANLAEYIEATYTNAAAAEASASAASASATAAATSEASAQMNADSVENLYNSIETAKQNANTAAQNAQDAADALANLTAEAVTLEAGEEATAAYSDGTFTFGIPQGAQGLKGDSGVGVATHSMFWLYVDDNSDLYAVYNDPASPPKFYYDTSEGNLYYLVGSELVTATGNPLTISDAEEGNASDVFVTVSAEQDGSDPSPSNVCGFVDHNGVTLGYGGAVYSMSDVDPVYAGMFDFVTGIITRTYKTKTFNGNASEGWVTYLRGDGVRVFQTTITGMQTTVVSANTMCDRLAYSASGLDSNYTFYAGGDVINLRCDDCTTVTAFLTWLSSNPLTFLYPLAVQEATETGATGYTFALTTGDNTFTTSGDSVTVDYVQAE